MRILLALAALVLLGGCSALRFAYDNADTYLRWRASSYFEVSGPAADELDDIIHDVLAWHQKAAHAAGCQPRLARQQLAPVEPADIVDAVGAGLGLDAIKTDEIGLVPGDDDGAGLEQRQTQPLADCQILGPALAHAGELEAARGRVEAGMKDGAVGLAGTGEDIRAALEQDGPPATER